MFMWLDLEPRQYWYDLHDLDDLVALGAVDSPSHV
jgi:hypothetical protein